MADFLRSPGTVSDAYSALRGIFCKADAGKLCEWITGSKPQSPEVGSQTRDATAADSISRLELTRYMRNQLLRDSDVMSMAHGLELRVPFVDKALFESIACIPAGERLQANKRLLTDAVPEVPDWVVNQKKRGFLFPYEKWLASGWGETFDRLTALAPVKMPNWYQRWSLFTLHSSLEALKLPSVLS